MDMSSRISEAITKQPSDAFKLKNLSLVAETVKG